MGNSKANFLFLNSKFVAYEKAKIYILTPSIKYGVAIYEETRGYWVTEDNQIYLFRLNDHLRRLFQSIELTWMKALYTFE